ncbi:MAG: tetratricopeptide repeat protein [Balneolaceae bacterium]
MKHHLNPRMASLVLVFGIFFTLSCSTFNTSKESAESLFQQNNYQKALQAVDRELEDNPDNPELLLLKGQILKQYAVNNYLPEQRKSVYQNFRNTLLQTTYSESAHQNTADSLLVSAWRFEQSSGVELLQQDESQSFDQHFERVIAHFDNATEIIPDSIVTYNLKATTYYRHGNLADAIATLEGIEEAGMTRPPETCEKLAYLYLEAGQVDESIWIYESLAENNPDMEIYHQGLVNSYILGNRHEEAVGKLNELIERYPNRMQYREAHATERYYLLRRDLEEQINEPSADPVSADDAQSVVNELNQISDTFREVDQSLPSSEERQQRIASFLVNSAAILEQLSQVTENEDAAETLRSHSEDQLNASIGYWQSLYDSNSDQTAYARSLVDVYKKLGMESEAELLEQQINF